MTNCAWCDGLVGRQYYQGVPNVGDLCNPCHEKWNDMDEKTKIPDAVPILDQFTTKDSGEREDFTSGAKRDTQGGKPRYDLIPPCSLKRLADLYTRGAEKYGEHNWEKGIPMSRTYASMFRHMMQWAEGDCSEDHLAAVAWNAFALIYYEEAIKKQELSESLNDMPQEVKS